jgi:hypothetical protein
VVLIGSLMLLVGAPVAWAGLVAVGDSAESVESVGERPGLAIGQSVDAAPEPASAAPNVAGPDVERIGIPVEPRAVIAPNAPVSVAIDKLGVPVSSPANHGVFLTKGQPRSGPWSPPT